MCEISKVFAIRLTRYRDGKIRVCGKDSIPLSKNEIKLKKSKTALLLYCFNTAGEPHTFVLYKLLALEHLFIENY